MIAMVTDHMSIGHYDLGAILAQGIQTLVPRPSFSFLFCSATMVAIFGIGPAKAGTCMPVAEKRQQGHRLRHYHR